ncbi:uncharacterized protein TNCV_4947681 [Trichonephila clavipes]|nr:uncharacterized protein TNCV_4947681 [Trichonephila clavipes]
MITREYSLVSMITASWPAQSSRGFESWYTGEPLCRGLIVSPNSVYKLRGDVDSIDKNHVYIGKHRRNAISGAVRKLAWSARVASTFQTRTAFDDHDSLYESRVGGYPPHLRPNQRNSVVWGKISNEVANESSSVRSGLSCPRYDPDMKRRCDEVTSPIPTEKDREVSQEECDNETTQKKIEASSTTAIPDTTTIEYEISLLKNDTWRQTLKDNVDLQYFFYRMLRPYHRRQRSKREQKTTESEELIPCEWNGDCPCPLICCKAGEGCPRRCKMGIRLPPPWGK